MCSGIQPVLGGMAVTPFSNLYDTSVCPVRADVGGGCLMCLVLSGVFLTRIGLIARGEMGVPGVGRRRVSEVTLYYPGSGRRRGVIMFLSTGYSRVSRLVGVGRGGVSGLGRCGGSLVCRCIANGGRII